MRYKTILADPPWPISLVGGSWNSRHSRPETLPYNTMTMDDIKALPVNALADDDALLFLWTTDRYLHEAFHVLEAWDFRYHGSIYWNKPSGVGSWFVSRVQPCLVGVKGRMRMKERYKPNVLFAPSRRHSQKPECSYDLIERVAYDPRIELFARTPRPGWTVLGDGIDGQDIRVSMDALTH